MFDCKAFYAFISALEEPRIPAWYPKMFDEHLNIYFNLSIDTI